MRLSSRVPKKIARYILAAVLANILHCLLWASPLYAENVIISGTTFKVLAGTTVVSAENLVIKNGATLENNGVFILKKSIINEHEAPDPIGMGRVECSGTEIQSVVGKNIIQSLTVDNAAGITMSGNTVINGTLDLQNGRIILGDFNLHLGEDAVIAGTPSALEMIVVSGSGELRKQFPSGFTGGFTFPVGDDTGAGNFSPVALVFASGAFDGGNYIGVTLRNEVYPDPDITGNYLNRYWSLSASGIANFSCDATFQYLPADVTGVEDGISCIKAEPSSWVTYGLTNTSSHQLSASGITAFGSFTGFRSTTPPANQALANILIPEGISHCYDATQILTVAGNGASFIVENSGSVTLVAGVKIVLLPGVKVNSGGQLNGYITTNNTFCGMGSNQLVAAQQTENSLEIGTPEEKKFIKVYPNPTAGIVMVELMETDQNSEFKLNVYSLFGDHLVQKTLSGGSGFQFSLAGKPGGLYIVHVQSGERSEITRVIKTN